MNAEQAERDRARWLRERGFSRWKPAYYEMTEEQRGWLVAGNTDAEDALGRILDELPGERLLPWCKAYEAILGGGVETADEAHGRAWDLAIQMVEDAQNIGSADFERWFPIKPADLDRKVLDMLRVWGREEDGEYYE